MAPAPDDARSAFGCARVSPQRRIILDAVNAMPGAFTVDALLAVTRTLDARAGTSTVYRAVGALEASGWLEIVGKRNDSTLYARCAAGGRHHHHVVCERCGRVEATECSVAREAAAPDGFRITRHEVTLWGVCPQCACAELKDA